MKVKTTRNRKSRSSVERNQNAVTAYFSSMKLLSFGFAERPWFAAGACHLSHKAHHSPYLCCGLFCQKNTPVWEGFSKTVAIFFPRCKTPWTSAVCRCLLWSVYPTDCSATDCHKPLKQCWYNVGPASQMLGQHYTNTDSTSHAYWDCSAGWTGWTPMKTDRFRLDQKLSITKSSGR